MLNSPMKRIAIIENSEGLGRYFTKYMEDDEYRIYPVWKEPDFPDDSFHSFIFTGDYNNISNGLLPLHIREMEFFSTIEHRKVFASCFFHQLLGRFFGGEVGRRERRHFGWQQMHIEGEHPVLKGLDDPFFLCLNVDEIRVRPENTTVLATNPECRYQMMHYNENVLTCQCHPEIFKKEGLEGIERHRDSLMDGCPDLDGIVSKTRKRADDKSSRIFLSNLTEWLRS
jgi:GMP synthase-like glutamine amidotransferase